MDPFVVFSRYFQAFEEAVAGGDWHGVAANLTPDVQYEVRNVPFACALRGRDAVVAAFQRSVGNFDQRMDGRSLDILSISRLSEHEVRAELVSGYARDNEQLTAPVSCNVQCREGLVTSIVDTYDPVWIRGAMQWLERHAPDLDPTYA